jgi:hypothetical protein
MAGNKELRNWRSSATRWNASPAHDKAFAEIINAIHQLMAPSEPNKNRPIGFAPRKENKTNWQ